MTYQKLSLSVGLDIFPDKSTYTTAAEDFNLIYHLNFFS